MMSKMPRAITLNIPASTFLFRDGKALAGYAGRYQLGVAAEFK
jgi:hypothetical protein